MHATDALTEADRQMTICNACRYCEGLCAVFPAMEMHKRFASGDLRYLANLCHNCGACYYDCQFATPHEFAVDVPKALATVRYDSYRDYAWPRALAPLFDRNGVAIALILVAAVAVFLLGFVAANDPAQLFAVHTGPGAFYRLMSHEAMVTIFGATFLYAIVAIAMGFRNFWQDANAVNRVVADTPSLWQAVKDVARLRYLEGGGVGCMNEDERPRDPRRVFHHLTFYGFLFAFAATSVGTIYHYGFGRIAPYPWWDLPPMLGTIGGIGLVIGTGGLLAARMRRDPALVDRERNGMNTAFILTLFIVAATGLVLHGLRATPAMGTLLAVHLGAVFGFFVTMPYSKFVHGFYRAAALVRYAASRRAGFVPEAGGPARAAAVPDERAAE